MLALLICNYNKDIGQLLEEIHTEISNFDLSVEVLIGEDCPDSLYNENNKIQCEKLGFRYIINLQNLGRSKNRNHLASLSNKPFLVFMDGDALYTNPKFLTNYLDFSKCNSEITVGGVSYDFGRPDDKDLLLHWKYGRVREGHANTNNNFHSFNFMIKKEIFEKLKFSEDFIGYGYEDLEFAIRAKNAGIVVKYIDNPLFHYGLNKTNIFLQNHLDAMTNLYYWNRGSNFLIKNKIVNANELLKRVGLNKIFANAVKLFQPLFINQLKSSTPILYLLDLIKLQKYIELDIKNQ
ncbi:MAG: glycosyltransferase family 2 protein [Saprospiraceae bacterium]|nr:glycosyltransferase family 2 protein [Saprospiraceae bacterium]